jgi:DNA-binding NarL/FixJ family response regulator
MLSLAQRTMILQMYQHGISSRQITKELKLSRNAVRRVIHTHMPKPPTIAKPQISKAPS